MQHPNRSLRLLAAGLAALACSAVSAAPVTLNLQGTVSGYSEIDLAAGLPIGTAVNLSVSFNETFSDGFYDFSDMSGPISGAMTAAGGAYGFDDVRPISYRPNNLAGGAVWVQLLFTGSGPSLGSGTFEGLLARFTPALTLFDEVSIVYRFADPLGGFSPVFGYAQIAPSSYTVTPGVTAPVPEPNTLALVLFGLLVLPAASALRRRSD